MPQTGNVAYSSPRGVQVQTLKGTNFLATEFRNTEPHSAVQGDIVFLTETLTDAQMLIDRWPEIMEEINTIVSQMISNQEETGGDG